MQPLTPTRRGLLGVMAAVPAMGALGMGTSAVTPPSSWRSAVIAYERAAAAEKAYDAGILDPARAAWQASIDAIPHVEATLIDAVGKGYAMSTADPWAVKTAQRELSGKRPWHPDDHDYRDYCQKIADGAAWRESERERIAKARGIDKLWARSEALGEETYEALEAVMNMPVTSLSELREKMEMMHRREGFEDHSWVDALMSDIRRLAGEVRS